MVKKSFLFIFLLYFYFFSLCAQGTDSVRMQVNYIATFRNYVERPNAYTEEKVLEIGDHRTAFYGRWQRKREELADTAMRTHMPREQFMLELGKYPTPRQFYSIFENYPSQGVRTVTDKILKTFVYKEPIPTLRWTMEQRDTTILDIPCQFAKVEMGGRVWTACFAPSIPSQAGPWKLHGLPGLILYAHDNSGIFSFEAIEIKKGNSLMKRPRDKKAIATTREEFHQLMIEDAANPQEFNKRFGIIDRAWGPDGKPLIYKKKTCIFMEE